jgi:hypothetical protein
MGHAPKRRLNRMQNSTGLLKWRSEAISFIKHPSGTTEMEGQSWISSTMIAPGSRSIA